MTLKVPAANAWASVSPAPLVPSPKSHAVVTGDQTSNGVAETAAGVTLTSRKTGAEPSKAASCAVKPSPLASGLRGKIAAALPSSSTATRGVLPKESPASSESTPPNCPPGARSARVDAAGGRVADPDRAGAARGVDGHLRPDVPGRAGRGHVLHVAEGRARGTRRALDEVPVQPHRDRGVGPVDRDLRPRVDEVGDAEVLDRAEVPAGVARGGLDRAGALPDRGRAALRVDRDVGRLGVGARRGEVQRGRGSGEVRVGRARRGLDDRQPGGVVGPHGDGVAARIDGDIGVQCASCPSPTDPGRRRTRRRRARIAAWAMKSVPLERVHTATASPDALAASLSVLASCPRPGDVDRGAAADRRPARRACR